MPYRIFLRSALAASLAVALSSCFTVQGREDEAHDKERGAYASCEAAREAGKLKTHVDVVACAAPKIVTAYEEAGYSFMDLVYISIEARRNGASRIDLDEATPAEVQHDLDQLDARVRAEEQRRIGIMMKYGGNPQPVAPEVLVAGLGTLVATDAPTNRSGLPPTCFAVGTFKHCS